jgi:hypothetical protein
MTMTPASLTTEQLQLVHELLTYFAAVTGGMDKQTSGLLQDAIGLVSRDLMWRRQPRTL